MKLSRRKNRLNYAAEGKPPVRARFAAIQRRLSIWVYYAVLLVVFFLVGKFAWSYFFVISTEGVVQVQQWSVRAPYDLRINTLYFNEGDTISEGDTLFHAEQVKLKKNKPQRVTNQRDKEILLMEYKLKQNYVVLVSHKRHQGELRIKIEKMKQRIYLELPVRGSLENRQAKLVDVERKLAEIRHERKMLKQAIKDFDNLPVEDDSGDGFSAEVSRVKGLMSTWLKGPGDMVLKGEQIAVIGSLEKPELRAYFDIRHLNSLKVGKEIDVNLPSGDTYDGIISVIYREARPMPKTFTTSSYDTEPKIMVDVVPGENADWPLIDGIVVSVSIRK